MPQVFLCEIQNVDGKNNSEMSILDMFDHL